MGSLHTLSGIDTIEFELGFFEPEFETGQAFNEFNIDCLIQRYSPELWEIFLDTFGGNIIGYVWNDENNNALHETTEGGIKQRKVYLSHTATGEILDSTWSDADGSFAFPNYNIDNYSVWQDAPPECWTATYPINPDTHFVSLTPQRPDTVVHFGNHANGTGYYKVQRRWNMRSHPRIGCDANLLAQYPEALSSAFVYNPGTGYQSYSIVPDPTKGFWIKFPAYDSVLIVGTASEGIYNGVVSGWNLVGTIAYPVPVESVTTMPAGIIHSEFFGYNGGYIPTDTLHPGQGYWIKIDTIGVLVITMPGANAQQRGMPVSIPKVAVQNMNRLTLEDAEGYRQTLYFTRELNQPLERFELPPRPAAEIFDVRFASGRYAEQVSNKASIVVQGASYPIKTTWDIQDAETYRLNGYILAGQGSTVLAHETKLSLEHSASTDNPVEFSLHQNYPNPFNPTTNILYSIPHTRYVTLKVFNLLGQDVATLVNENTVSGSYTAIWDASTMPSGVYFLRLVAGDITKTTKLILMK